MSPLHLVQRPSELRAGATRHLNQFCRGDGGPELTPSALCSKGNWRTFCRPPQIPGVLPDLPPIPAGTSGESSVRLLKIPCGLGRQEVGDHDIYSATDPRTVIATDPVTAQLHGGIHPGFAAWNVIATLLVGGVLAWLTRWARETVRAAVELEAANRRIPQEQAELIAEGKMTSLTQLVAGIAHELPSPPGQSNSRHRHVVGTSEDLNAALEQRIAAQHASAGG